MDADKKALYAELQRYAPLAPASFALLECEITVQHLPRKGVFAEAGSVSRTVAFVAEGSLRQFYPTSEGKELTSYFFFTGNLMGSFGSMVTGQPSAVTLEALTPCRLLVWQFEHLLGLYEGHLEWANWGRCLAQYLTLGLEQRLASQLMRNPEERYLDLLASSKKRILEQVPQHYIADYLGITPVSLSRIRQRILH